MGGLAVKHGRVSVAEELEAKCSVRHEVNVLP